jgi:PII-like signaling protein
VNCLKLTTYFGERHRTADGLVADALLDIYGRHRVTTSILLRGVEGFGLKHHLRSDRLLTLSEDLPVVSVAVDEPARIEAVLDDVLAIRRHGLITLARARMLSGDISALTQPEHFDEATKLTINVGRQQQVGNTPAFLAVCDLLHRRGIAGATVLLGVDGTARGERQRARFFGRNADVPMMIVAVGDADHIAHALPELDDLLHRPLLTLERVRVCKRDGQLLTRPRELPATDEHGHAVWQKLMIYTSEQAKHNGTPVHIALVRALRQSSARGATTLRGIWGFHGDHAPHGDRLLQLRRHVPIVTIVIDSPERIATAFDIVNDMTAERGLVTSEMIPTIAGANTAPWASPI